MQKYIILLFNLVPFFLGAQKITVSEELPLMTEYNYEIIGEISGQTLVLMERGNNYHVYGFNERLQNNYEKELELDKRQVSVLGTNEIDSLYSLYYTYRQKGQIFLKIHTYDAGTNLIDSSTIWNFGNLFYNPRFEILRSEDKSKVLVYFVENSSIFRMICIDNSKMKVIWDHNYKPKDFYKDRPTYQILLTNSGRYYGVFIKDNVPSRRKEHAFVIDEYASTMSEVRTKDIALYDKLTYDAWFTVDNLNGEKLLAGGLYTDNNRIKAMGSYFLRYDPISTNYTIKHSAFELGFSNRFMNYKRPKKKPGILDLEINNAIVRQDGGLVFIAEKIRTYQRTNNTETDRYFRAGRLSDDYHYDDLLVVSYEPDGEISWREILQKKQFSQDDFGFFSSYYLFRTPEQIHFLFNDEIKNNNTVSEYIMNGLGQYDRKSLFNTTHLEIKLRLTAAYQVNTNRLLIPSERRNRLKLVRMDYGKDERI